MGRVGDHPLPVSEQEVVLLRLSAQQDHIADVCSAISVTLIIVEPLLDDCATPIKDTSVGPNPEYSLCPVVQINCPSFYKHGRLVSRLPLGYRGS